MTTSEDTFNLPTTERGLSEAELSKVGLEFEDDANMEGEKESSSNISPITAEMIHRFRIRKNMGKNVLASYNKAA